MATKRWKQLKYLNEDENSPNYKKMEYLHTEFVDARTAVQVPMEADEVFGMSKPGISWQCMVANAIKIFYRKNPQAWSHGCKEAYVERRDVYITDKMIKGPPIHPHSVRYFADFGQILDAFDDEKITLAKFKKQFGERMILRLRRATKRGGQDRPHARDTRVRRERPTYVSRGAWRRAVNAGLLHPTSAPKKKKRG